MKKLLTLMLCAVLAVLPLSALAQTDLDAFQRANQVTAVLEVAKDVDQHITRYDLQDGSVADSSRIYNWIDDKGAFSVAFAYGAGHWSIFSGSLSYGYNADSDMPFVIGFLGDAHEQLINYLMNQNIGQFAQGQRIVSEETAGDGLLHITVEGPAPAFYDPAMQDENFVYRYLVDPQTLIISAYDIYLLGEDGSETLYYHFDHHLNGEMDLPDLVGQIETAEAWREMRVIMDPGTENERETLLTAPLNMAIWVMPPEGYALFSDAACTQASSDIPDENGNYPETQTVYAAPAAQ